MGAFFINITRLQGIKFLVLVVLFCLSVTASSKVLDCKTLDDNQETFNYKVSYQGVFSGGTEIGIANAALKNSLWGDAYIDNRLFVTSSPFAHVESVFPFRFQMRSLSNPDCGHAKFYEVYRKTGKLRHEFVALNPKTKKIVRYRKRQKKQTVLLPELLTKWRQNAAAFHFNRAISWDMGEDIQNRLSLLHRIRQLPLKVGDIYELPVSNSDDRFMYQVKVEAVKKLDIQNKKQSALKLKVDGYELKKGDKEIAHSPIYIWLSLDKQRQPLQFVSHHQLGKFFIRLQEAG